MTVMPSDTVNRIADAIFRAEGGSKTKWPYGVISVSSSSPRHVCINTINHAWYDFEGEQIVTVVGVSSHTSGKSLIKIPTHADTLTPVAVSLPFIQFLGRRYCPPSVDEKGYEHWTNNCWRILQKENKI